MEDAGRNAKGRNRIVSYFMTAEKSSSNMAEKKATVSELKKVWSYSNASWDASYTGTDSLKGIIIKDYKGSDSNVTIPSVIGQKTVYATDTCAFSNNQLLESIHFPETVFSTGDRTFKDCRYLKQVIIDGETMKVGSGVFSGCTRLSDIQIQANNLSFGIHPFQGCKNITDEDGLVILETNVGRILCDCQLPIKVEEIIVPEGVIRIDGHAFAKEFNPGMHVHPHDSLKTVVLPESLQEIGPSAFSGAVALEKVVMRSHLKTISHMAFCGCSSLREIHIPDSVEFIGSGAFKYCNKLTILGSAKSVAAEYSTTYGIPFIDEQG